MCLLRPAFADWVRRQNLRNTTGVCMSYGRLENIVNIASPAVLPPASHMRRGVRPLPHPPHGRGPSPFRPLSCFRRFRFRPPHLQVSSPASVRDVLEDCSPSVCVFLLISDRRRLCKLFWCAMLRCWPLVLRESASPPPYSLWGGVYGTMLCHVIGPLHVPPCWCGCAHHVCIRGVHP